MLQWPQELATCKCSWAAGWLRDACMFSPLAAVIYQQLFSWRMEMRTRAKRIFRCWECAVVQTAGHDTHGLEANGKYTFATRRVFVLREQLHRVIETPIFNFIHFKRIDLMTTIGRPWAHTDENAKYRHEFVVNNIEMIYDCLSSRHTQP